MLSPHLPVYFENAAGRLAEHPDEYILFECYPGKRKLSDLQGLLTHTGHSLQRNNWYKLLWDQCAMDPFTHEESLWIVDYWSYLVTQLLNKLVVAIVQPSNVYARLAMNQLLHEAQMVGLTYKVFEQEEAAAMWLQQVG